MRALIFVNGEYAAATEAAEYYIALAAAADLVIAADGGASQALMLGVTPDLLIGDFDSLAPEELEKASAAGAEIERHPVHKDQTDTELAVAAAEARGCDEIVLVGALGGEPDHLLGNLSVLRGLAQRDRTARAVAIDVVVRALCAPAKLVLACAPGTRVSLSVLTERASVTLSGFDYEVTHGSLCANSCVGLGNAVAQPPATITLHKGELLVFVFDHAEARGVHDTGSNEPEAGPGDAAEQPVDDGGSTGEPDGPYDEDVI